MSERLGMSHTKLLKTLSSREIAEYMAYDRCNGQDWQEKYLRELEEAKPFDKEQQVKDLKSLFNITNSK